MSKSRKLKAFDLFCGGGGLTVGLKEAGFDVVGAIEIEPHASSTYRVNHPKTKLFVQDIRYLHGETILELTQGNPLDLLAGCPPCQGFTSLTAKYHRDDPRNQLIFEMLRLVEEIKPRAVMMENVPGLANRGQLLLNKMIDALNRLGYSTNVGVLQVADFGVPQFRRRLVLLAGLGFEIPLPIPTHSRTADQGLLPWKTVRDTIYEMNEPKSLSEAKKVAFPPLDWHIVRDLHPINKARLRAAKAGKSWKSIPENLRPSCHQGDYSGFPNVYGRMVWDDVSPTITGGCTTLSRGRFGHPQKNRTISVREAACLQTFPDDYIFDTPLMDRVCNIIGNALPCTFASIVAKACMKELRKDQADRCS